jgi:hypothetical protein
MQAASFPGTNGLPKDHSHREDAVERFIAQFAHLIIGTLSGFDRLVFRGHLRRIIYPAGMTLFLSVRGIRFKEFREFMVKTTDRLQQVAEAKVRKLGRPVRYLESSKDDKEAIAREIARKDGIDQGLIALLTCVEPCHTFGLGSNPKSGAREIRSKFGRCLHHYYYVIDPVFGFMNARIQTWFPFSIQICINGREWLARQMDRAGLTYERRDNCFVRISDFAEAQHLMDRQLRASWPGLLNRIACWLNPLHDDIFQDFPVNYYWSVYQSEWASDIVFRSAAALHSIYPTLTRHAITSFGSGDVMRFLGGKVHGAFQGEIISEFKDRPEGVRVKHWVKTNSIKLYDKKATVLRPETTINDPDGIKVFRPKEGEPRGDKEWRPLRRGIADLHRRAQVSQAANDRYLDALAAVNTSTPLGELLHKVCHPTRHHGKCVRGLRPWASEEIALLEAINRGEFCINGLRNRDLQRLLYATSPSDAKDQRRRSARISYLLRILRAHGILHKIPKSHRYRVSSKGRDILTAALAAYHAPVESLSKLAA